MTQKEQLMILQKIKEQILIISHLNLVTTNEREILKEEVKKIIILINQLTDDLIMDIPECFKIVITEDLNISKGEVAEVMTNISTLPFTSENIDITFDGFTGPNGIFYFAIEDILKGMSVFAHNQSAPLFKEETDFFTLSEPTFIKKGLTIGLGIQKNQKPDHELIKERVKNSHSSYSTHLF